MRKPVSSRRASTARPAPDAALTADRRRLITVLLVTAFYCAVELAASYYADSLALLSDAIHLLTDIGALGLALLTLWISRLPARGAKTYGYLRAEVLGAVLNGLALWLLVAFIWYKALRRLDHPPAVQGGVMMGIACLGLLVNGFAAWMTHGSRRRGEVGLAVSGAFVHVLSDLIGSLGILVSGALARFFGWRAADPAVSLLIGVLVLYGSWGLIREGVDVLMEAVPAQVDLEELRRDLLALGNAEEVHDLHVWCLASRQLALSAHVVVGPHADHDRVLADISAMLERDYNIRHVTIQIERRSRRPQEPQHF
jgi:cobalt-zinc-cadmium efflux system protein